MNNISNQFLSIEQITDKYLGKPQNLQNNISTPGVPFEEILKQFLSNLLDFGFDFFK